MAIRKRGQCHPGKLFGCKSPISPQALFDLIPQIAVVPDMEFMTVPCQNHTPLPNGLVNGSIAVLVHPSNSQIAMLHIKNYEALIIRRVAFEKIFHPGMSYVDLVDEFKKRGLGTEDVDFVR